MKLYLAVAFAAVFVWTVNASAQGKSCKPHAEMVSFLFDRFSEEPRALGMINQNALMTVYVSNAGTWTIVVTKTDGVSCIVAAGGLWEEREITIPGQDS